MVVRIRFGMGRPVQRGKAKNRKLALAMGALLTPAAVMASALGLWRLAADMKWTGEFGISSGLFSHWQVWLACAGVLHRGAWVLTRYGRDHDGARS
jgi:hypothetical protein